jgi:hypothetical protein
MHRDELRVRAATRAEGAADPEDAVADLELGE